MEKLNFRGVQLDLHRQYETVDFICSFIDFAASCNYNALLLSLGDRVTTPSYPFRRGVNAYSAPDIRRIVAHGAGQGVEIVPCVPTLGHAEDFLSHPEMEELAELRHGVKGRWGDGGKTDFCASSDKVYDFLERYFSELAPLFPSQWFHAGWDEAWNVGFCELCAPRAGGGRAGESELCIGNLLRTRDILTKLGKRMLIWDDMFEYYPELLEAVPRDVVMVNWQYQRHVRNYEAHFVDLAREDRLRRYRELGFDCHIAPADYTIGNIRSFCDCAADNAPSGALLTLWGKKLFFNHKSYPAIAYAGARFSGRSDAEAWEFMLHHLFGDAIMPGTTAASALRNALENSWIHGDMIINDGLLRTISAFGDDPTAAAGMELTRQTLETVRCENEPGKTVLADLKTALAGAVLREEISHAVHGAFDGKSVDFAALQEKTERQAAVRAKMWEQLRPGVAPCETTVFAQEIKTLLAKMEEQISGGSWVRIRFMLPTQYGAPRTRILLCVAGQWREVGTRVCKMTRVAEDDWDKCHFETIFFCPPCVPEAIRLEVDACGGTGIVSAHYHAPNGIFVPAGVLSCTGQVLNPHHLLTDDARFAWFGSGDIRADFGNRAAAAQKHGVTLQLECP